LSGATSITARAIAAQPAWGQPPGPVQHQRFGGARLGGVQHRGGTGDDDDLGLPQGPVVEGCFGAGQLDLEVMGQVQHRVGGPAGLGQHSGHLGSRGLIPALRQPRRAFRRTAWLRAPPDELRHRGTLTGRGVGLDPVPGRNRPGHLIITRTLVAVVVPGRLGGEPGQRPASRHHIQRHPGAEPGRPAQVLARTLLRRSGLARAATALSDGRPTGQAPPRRLGSQGGLLRGDLPALSYERVNIDIPRSGVLRFLLVRTQLPFHRLAPGQPVLLSPAGIAVPPRSRSNRPLRHIHHPFGLMILK
jgi:hypothetical protein